MNLMKKLILIFKAVFPALIKMMEKPTTGKFLFRFPEDLLKVQYFIIFNVNSFVLK